MCYRSTLLIILFSALTSAFLFAQNLIRGVPPKEAISELPAWCNSDFIIIKVAENPVTNSAGYFPDKDPQLLTKIQGALSGKQLLIQNLIKQPKAFLLALKRKGEERSGITLGNLSLFYKIDLKDATATEKIVIHNALLSLPELETAYFPLDYQTNENAVRDIQPPAPDLTATPDFSAKQFYLNPAPSGVDAKYAWTKPGGDGTGINFCDVELGVNKTHEDIAHGNITDISVWPSTVDDHGTAVHGVIYADHNGLGVDGMAHKVVPYFSNAKDSLGGFDIANSMARAIPYLDSGDVMLLEMMDQSGAPNSTYAPVEFSQAEFDVIQNMTASGIIVIEAAGNGNKNLDDQTKYGQKFDSTFRYSGAFMVGGIKSGVSGGTTPAHERLHPSSYGSRVDFHAYSEMVATCGYGDLYGTVSNEKYTAKFFGTSSASPIIAGAAILMESIYKNVSGGQTLDHKQLKSLLRHGATPSYAPATDKVGVMPNLKQAIDHMLAATGISGSAPKENTFSVYPTLTNDVLMVTNNEQRAQQINYAICDLSGRQVLESSLQLAHSNTSINVSALTPGMYFLRITDGNVSANIKFVRN